MCPVGGRVYARTHKHEATHASFSPIKQLYESIKGMLTPDEFDSLALFGNDCSSCLQPSVMTANRSCTRFLFYYSNLNGHNSISLLSNWTLCRCLCTAGESMVARHSIDYNGLASYFYLFSAFRHSSSSGSGSPAARTAGPAGLTNASNTDDEDHKAPTARDWLPWDEVCFYVALI